LAESFGVRIGSINPNLFQEQCYKFGSLCNSDAVVRETALKHVAESIEIGAAVGSKHLTLWLADGSNYPGQEDLRSRKHNLQASLREISRRMNECWADGTLLVEYKPFEPAFYHTDIADWGMAYVFCRDAGPQAKVLVDTGHHLQGTNIAHVVAFLLDEEMLGGFHFNDRKYADDDLTLGSIDPHGMFLIFDQIAQYEFATGQRADLAYMIDQSHNLKPKLEAMVQSVCEAQKLFVKAQLVDRKGLAVAQQRQDIVGAENILRTAFDTDVGPLLAEWRKNHRLPENPLNELRNSQIVDQLATERNAKRARTPQPLASQYV
jgi:L-rhamnose isomerase/sugar isomerase